MATYVAFLRALNVGGHHTVTMTALRRLFEEAGGSDVETVIASGNVVFASGSRSVPALESRLARHLEARLGYAIATFVRTPAEVAAVASHRPFPRPDLEAPGHGLYVGFLAGEPGGAARRRVLGLATPGDAFAMRGKELYWLRRGRFSDSALTGGILEKALGQPTTLRRTTTLVKIVERCAAVPEAR